VFTVCVENGFTASHQLTLRDGSKEPLHVHHWQVFTEVKTERLNKMGIVIDFHKLIKMVDSITEIFQNAALNDFEYFKKNAAAEALAKYIYEKLEPKLPSTVTLYSVKVVEEPGCSAKFNK